MTADSAFEALGGLVGTWTTEATHPAVPGVVHGTVFVEWLEGRRFLIHRARTDHPDFPDSVSIIGRMEHDRVDGASSTTPSTGDAPPMRMHYFDSRGVFRIYEVSIDATSWRLWRDAPEFSQRFTGTMSARGDAVAGRWQVSRDNVHWTDDLEITYRRR